MHSGGATGAGPGGTGPTGPVYPVKQEPSGTKILWHSNAPWVGTGYGSQTALIGPLLQEKLDYHVAFSAFYGLQGSRLGWASLAGVPYVVYPGGKDGYGNDVLGAHAKHWFAGKGGIVILLTDPWVISYKIAERMPVVAWVPVDHDPLIPATKKWFKKGGAIPLAMSVFGDRVLREAGFDPVLYCPHGYSARTYHPNLDREECRKILNIPQDAFVVGMVAANKGKPSRKGFSIALQAFSEFQRKYAKEAVLYLHTQLEDPDGENLLRLCKQEKVRPLAPDQYGYALGMPESVLAATYSAFDVLLHPAWGEGFGIPIVEAQACGTPAIVTNFSSMPEVAPVEVGNWNIDGQLMYTHWDSKQMLAPVDGLIDALVNAYEEADELRKQRRDRVATWVRGEYEANHVIETWMKPALEKAEQELQYRELYMIDADDDD